MKIIVSGVANELSIIDPKSGVNFIADFIGNADGFKDFKFDEESDAYVCDAGTFSWWENVVSDNQAVLYRIANLKEHNDPEAVDDVLSSVSVDLEDHAAATNSALDEAFGEVA